MNYKNTRRLKILVKHALPYLRGKRGMNAPGTRNTALDAAILLIPLECAYL